jgi:NitT/TauT family transport system substrate-binding protein
MLKRPLAILLAALSLIALAPLAPAARGAEPVTVRVGVIGSISDAPIMIADRKGYFREEGITLQYQQFQSAALMVAPLGAGQLDVGAGGTSAGLFNAVARGIDMRIVADKASDPPGYGFVPLLVRTELIKSGRFKSLKDIRGLRVAVSAPGSSSWPELDAVAAKAGVPFSEVKPVPMDYSDQIVAYKNGSIDAGVTIEPSATLALQSGAVRKIMSSDEYYPNQEVAVLIYAGSFIKAHRDVGQRFMRAYLRGVRYYNDALAHGHFAGPTADDVVKILTETTNVKDPALIRAMTPNGVDPNGRVNVASMNRDLAFYRRIGMISGTIPNADVTLDPSFAEEAVKELGPYKPRT